MSLQFDCILGCGVEHKAPITAIERDQQYVFSASRDGVILVWDPKEGNAVREMSMTSSPISSMLRVDNALWVGSSLGTVEIYDIFGDDTNGIECLSNTKPHHGPVTQLLRIGTSEVWSVSGSALPHPNPRPSNESIAIWDTTDFACIPSHHFHSSGLMTVAVVERKPLEDVSVLALTNTLEPQKVNTMVHGIIVQEKSDDEDSMDELVSDLENKLVQANEEIQRLRTVSKQPQSQPSPEYQSQSPSFSPQSWREGEHANCVEPCADHLCPVKLQREYYNFSDEDKSQAEIEKVDPIVIKGSVSETISSSLNKVSELLVSLLADDVLAPKVDARESNEVLRTAVANITKELNVGKNLIENCTISAKNDDTVDTVADHIYPLARSTRTPTISANTVETSMNRQSTTEHIIKKGNENVLTDSSQPQQAVKLRRLETELANVIKERDAICKDLDHLRTETEATMTALEQVIEDRTSKIAEKDGMIARLRKECSASEKRVEKERALRVELKESLESELDELSAAAEATARTFEEQLSGAYDKLETKAIENQAHREELHALHQKLGTMRQANQSMALEYSHLEEQLTESRQCLEEVKRTSAVRTAKSDNKFRAEKEADKKKHARAMEILEGDNDDLRRRLAACQDQFGKEKQRAYLELQTLKDERDSKVDELNQVVTQCAGMEKSYKAKVVKLETEFEEMKSRFNSEREDLERRLNECRHGSEVELLVAKGSYESELQKRNAMVDDLRTRLNAALSRDTKTSSLEPVLRIELRAMTEERDLLLKEVEQREVAEKHFESEAENLNSALSDLRLANDELQDLLEDKERDYENMQEKLKVLKGELCVKELHLQELEGIASTASVESTDISDAQKATNAILASASGERDQLSRQIDAMNRAYLAQERELNELREALSTRDEKIRLRDTFIDDLTKEREAFEPLSSPGVSLNVSPDEPESERKQQFHTSPQFSRADPSPGCVEAAEESIVCHALKEVQDGMSLTQNRLRDLTNTARRYKKFAQSHLDALPVLHELEGVLNKVSPNEGSNGNPLASARGIVQSLIAQYYTNSQKRAMMKDYDENMYRASSERLEALHRTISRLRKVRTGSEEVLLHHIDDIPNDVVISNTEKAIKVVDEPVLATRRLLTFN